MCDVRTRDQEHHADGNQEDTQRRTERGGLLLPDGYYLDPRRAAGSLTPSETGIARADLRRGHLDRLAVPDPRDRVVRQGWNRSLSGPDGAREWHERHPDLDGRIRKRKGIGHDADDRVGATAQVHRAAYDRGIATEVLTPRRPAEDRDVFGAGHRVGVREGAAQHR